MSDIGLLADERGRLSVGDGAALLVGQVGGDCCCGGGGACDCDPSRPAFAQLLAACVGSRLVTRGGAGRYHRIVETRQQQGQYNAFGRATNGDEYREERRVVSFVRVCRGLNADGVLEDVVIEGETVWSVRVVQVVGGVETGRELGGTRVGQEALGWGDIVGTGYGGALTQPISRAVALPTLPQTGGIWPVAPLQRGNQVDVRAVLGVDLLGCGGTRTTPPPNATTLFWRYQEGEEQVSAGWSWAATGVSAFASLEVRRDLTCVQRVGGRPLPLDPALEAIVQAQIAAATGRRAGCATCGDGG